MPGRALRGLGVSILVLLDVSLKAVIQSGSLYLQSGFNPCSFGCQSERRPR